MSSISKFDKTLISKEHLRSIKGGNDITAVQDWCTYTGDHEDGDDWSFYHDGDGGGFGGGGGGSW